jgi:hypothetical protein
MPASNAERQKTFRRRLKQRLEAAGTPASLPDRPKIGTLPATKRWAAMHTQAMALLTTSLDEMQQYFEDRSEDWQQSDRGQAFQERLDAIEAAKEVVAELAEL